MPNRFEYTGDGEPGTAGAIPEGTEGAWWDEFFAGRCKGVRSAQNGPMRTWPNGSVTA